MKSSEIHQTSEFSVYREILYGDLDPITLSHCRSVSSVKLVQSANKLHIFSAPTKEEIHKYLKSINLLTLGYKVVKDYEIEMPFNDKEKIFEAFIRPRCHYLLVENIFLPTHFGTKSQGYYDLMIDEFARIKIRSNYIMSGIWSDEKTKSFVLRSLHLLHQYIEEAQNSFIKICSTSKNIHEEEDIYIIYVLNLFLIRSLVFYTKFFKIYLTEKPAVEKTLRQALQSQIPSKVKFEWINDHKAALYDSEDKFNSKYLVKDITSEYSLLGAKSQDSNSKNLTKEESKILALKGCIQANYSITDFLSILYKFVFEKDVEKKSRMTVKKSDMNRLLNYFCVDDKGNPLNRNTINTYFKPKNDLRRKIKDDSFMKKNSD